jgi:hypothetical protein
MKRRVSQLGRATLVVVLIVACDRVTATGGLVFQSDWSTATGTSARAVTDGGRWRQYREWNNGTGVQLLSVVTGGPGGRNALQLLQRGPSYAAAVEHDNVVPRSTDFYVRFYMRNDDTSAAGDHTAVSGVFSWENLTFMRKFGRGRNYSEKSGWQFVIALYGCGYLYPLGYWGPQATLSHGAWYRFEYQVHFVDRTHVQVHPRVYDASGTEILTDAEFQQSDYGSAVWNGRKDWTLASYYAAGFSFCVDPTALTRFALGNNGQQGAVDTGLAWYYADVQIRTDGWPGP